MKKQTFTVPVASATPKLMKDQRWLLLWFASSLPLSTLGCVAAEVGDEDVAQRSSALDFSQPIAVRVVSIASGTCAQITAAQISREIDLFNQAQGPDGLKFRLHRSDHIPLSVTDGDKVLTEDKGREVIKPVWDRLGLSTAIREQVVAAVLKKDENGSAETDGADLTFSNWLRRTASVGMPHQAVAWQGCGTGTGGNTGGYINTGYGNFVHEMGHGFGLNHTFSFEFDCNSWDLVYAARGSGKPNVFFKSRAECDAFASANAGAYSLYRLDPQDGRPAAKAETLQNGALTLDLPRCSSCTGSEVETYRTGDEQIREYSNWSSDGVLVGNAMGYWSGFGITRFNFSASQIAIHKDFVTRRQAWIFAQGNPVTSNPPSRSCGYLFPNEGLGRDEPYYSCDGRFRLYLQADGNLVLSQKATNGAYSIVLWATGSLIGTDTTDIRLIMQADGNLVVYDRERKPLWHTQTHGHPGAYVKISDSGDMKVRTADGSSFYWSTNTSAQ